MSETYSLAVRIAHWATVVLVLAQVSLAVLNGLLYEPRPVFAERLVQAHISLGAVILIITLCRAAMRLRSPVPPRPSILAVRVAARLVHTLLYLLLFVLPVTGYLKLAALGFEIRLFGAIPLPVLPLDVALATAARQLHEVIALALGVLLAIHIAAATFHRRFDGTAVLGHMRIGPART